MAHGADADSGTPVMLTPMFTDKLTPAALTPKPVRGDVMEASSDLTLPPLAPVS